MKHENHQSYEQKLVAPDTPETHRRAAKIIAMGGVAAFRTDTFYGLGADPFNREALRTINKLKGREDGKPILVVISDKHFADRFVRERSALFDILCERHWPGSLTIVAAAGEEVPVELTGGSGTVGVRWPGDEQVCRFVERCGGALTATSANPAGLAPARNAAQAAGYFHTAELELIVDGGATYSDKPSTVINVSRGWAHVLREGVVTTRELQQTVESIGAELRISD